MTLTKPSYCTASYFCRFQESKASQLNYTHHYIGCHETGTGTCFMKINRNLFCISLNLHYLCKCIAVAAHVVETKGWHEKAAVQDIAGKKNSYRRF